MKIERNMMKNVDRVNDELATLTVSLQYFISFGWFSYRVFTLNFKVMSRGATFAATSDFQSQMSESVLKRSYREIMNMARILLCRNFMY